MTIGSDISDKACIKHGCRISALPATEPNPLSTSRKITL